MRQSRYAPYVPISLTGQLAGRFLKTCAEIAQHFVCARTFCASRSLWGFAHFVQRLLAELRGQPEIMLLNEAGKDRL
jgi:hypothetical protein